jgi:hypothetical protein
VPDEEDTTKRQQDEDEEDERLAREVFKDVDGESVKRLRDDLEGPEEELNAAKIAMAKFAQPLTLPDFSAPLTKKRKQGGSLGLWTGQELEFYIIKIGNFYPKANSRSAFNNINAQNNNSKDNALNRIKTCCQAYVVIITCW